MSNIFMICENLEKTLSHIFGKYNIEDGLNIYIQSLKSKSKKLRKIEGWNSFYLPHSKATSTLV